MRKFLFILLFCLAFGATITARSDNNRPRLFGFDPLLRIHGSFGVTYNFRVSTEYNSAADTSAPDTFFFELPLHFYLEYRFIEWFSLTWGLEIAYGLHSYTRAPVDSTYTYYIHNLFLRTPVMIKFFPLVYKHDNFWNAYISVGLFLHFWPVNQYIIVSSSTYLSGNGYQPSHSEIDPSGIYTPVNIGLRLAFGNHFDIRHRGLFGAEVFTNFLFLPYVNGYYNNNYSRDQDTLLEFSLNIGVCFSFGGKIKGE